MIMIYTKEEFHFETGFLKKEIFEIESWISHNLVTLYEDTLLLCNYKLYQDYSSALISQCAQKEGLEPLTLETEKCLLNKSNIYILSNYLSSILFYFNHAQHDTSIDISLHKSHNRKTEDSRVTWFKGPSWLVERFTQVQLASVECDWS